MILLSQSQFLQLAIRLSSFNAPTNAGAYAIRLH
jgi:hypothetical protein